MPFRGEYFRLVAARAGLVRGLVYPVPDPAYPFLGVHFTPRIDGTVDIGPERGAGHRARGLPAARRRPRRALADAAVAGVPHAVPPALASGMREMHGSVSKRAYVKTARAYLPALRNADVVRAPAGVRAQAVDRDGSLVDDFRISRLGPVTAVRNAPSPAATSSLAIAEHIVSAIALAPAEAAQPTTITWRTPRAVHALDPVELDVAGGAGSADPGQRAGRVQHVERVGHVGDHLGRLDDADVAVGDEGDRATALTGAVVEDDRAGLGDAETRPGDDPVERVEVGGGQVVVHDSTRHLQIEVGRYDDPSALGQRGADPGLEVRGVAALDDGPVVGDALDEEGDGVGRRDRAGRRGTSATGGSGAVATAARTAARMSSRALTGGSPSPRCHQARNDSWGGAGRSRAPVQRDPGPGSRPSARRPPGSDVRPTRPQTRPTRPESRSAPPSRRASLNAQAAALIASASALGRPPRWASTTWRAQVDQDRRDVDLHRADLVAGAAQRRGVGQRVGLVVDPDPAQQRVEDRADRAGVDRAVGMPADSFVDRDTR